MASSKRYAPFPVLSGMNYFSILLAVVLLMSGTSCLTNKSLSGNNTGNNSGGDNAIEATLEQLATTEVPYQWFSGQGQGKIDWDGERYSVRLNVRIKRDSVIWMVITKLGFEVGRMLVTQDSAFFINRLDHTYSKYETEEFLKAYNVPADFEMFSRVFTAGAFIPPFAQGVAKESDGSIVVTGGEGVTAQHWFESAMLSRSFITDANEHEWTAGFSNYQSAETGQNFPFVRTNTVMIDGKPTVFDLEYTSVVIDVPQEFPFSIPSHYEKE